jgi:hypothetical protein
MTSDPRQRWLAALFVAASLLHLLPVWRVDHVPTQDGPSHLYNAAVLNELAAGTPQFRRVFVADLRPHPNWLTHAMLSLALRVAAPLVAEKLVFSIILLTFLGGCWTLAGAVDHRSRLYAFLAMPLAFHLLLQMGFYNYAMGSALLPWVVAAYWRGWRVASGALLVLCYLAHVVPAALALLSCAVIWLFRFARGGLRREWTRLLCLLPVALLIVWFVLQPGRPGGTWTWQGAWLWQPLSQVVLLFTFDARQLLFGKILGGVFGALLVVTLALENVDWRRRRIVVQARDVFLLLTFLATALYLAAPVSVEEGLVLKARLLLFPYLLVLPWLTPRLASRTLAIALALAACANVFFIRDHWKRNDKLIAPAIAPLAQAEPLRTIVPLVFERTTPHSHLGLLAHVSSYAAVERRLVDLGNYEGGYGHFPVAFRSDVRRPPIADLETNPGAFDPTAWSDVADYIYTWKMPPGSPVEGRLAERYELAARDGDAALYRRR